MFCSCAAFCCFPPIVYLFSSFVLFLKKMKYGKSQHPVMILFAASNRHFRCQLPPLKSTSLLWFSTPHLPTFLALLQKKTKGSCVKQAVINSWLKESPPLWPPRRRARRRPLQARRRRTMRPPPSARRELGLSHPLSGDACEV